VVAGAGAAGDGVTGAGAAGGVATGAGAVAVVAERGFVKFKCK